MKAIKKVAVTPVQTNEGTIINSFSTTDDKTKNAPSINAVETYVSNRLASLIVALNVDANSSATHSFSYPTGFTLSNSVPVAFGTMNSNVISAGINYLGGNIDAGSLLDSSFERYVNFKENEITIKVYNSTDSDKLISCKLVVMKVS